MWWIVALIVYALIVTVYAVMYFIALRRATKQLEFLLDAVEDRPEFAEFKPDEVRYWTPVQVRPS